jgi:protein tyrosine/serine phosphatase
MAYATAALTTRLCKLFSFHSAIQIQNQKDASFVTRNFPLLADRLKDTGHQIIILMIRIKDKNRYHQLSKLRTHL